MTQIRRAAVGAFAIGGVLLFAFALFLIGDRRLMFDRNFEMHTIFGKVTGLQVGTKVRVSGYDAGEVLEIAIPSRPSAPFRVRMRLRDDLRQLVRADSVSSLQSDGLVGSYFIQISSGSDDAPVVQPGDTIRGIDPVDFADLINEGRDAFQTVSREIVAVTNQAQAAIDPLIGTARMASDLLEQATDSVSTMAAASTKAADEVTGILAEVRGTVAEVRGGQGTFGRLLIDDAPFQRWVGIGEKVEQVVANLQEATAQTQALVTNLSAPGGGAQQLVQSMGNVMLDAREAVSDLSESTEAIKRNFLFRGFFRNRGFFDLDAVSQADYVSGVLERDGRVPLRVWVAASGLFERDANGIESLTLDGRRRLDAAMTDLVRYARNSPLVVEGYAASVDGTAPYLVSSDRALLVRDYLVNRFRRRVTLTGVMPMGSQATGSPTGDGRWSGVALALFANSDDIAP